MLVYHSLSEVQIVVEETVLKTLITQWGESGIPDASTAALQQLAVENFCRLTDYAERIGALAT